jgi:hypothetical protein
MSGAIEQGDGETIMLDRKAGQQGLAGDRTTVKRGEKEQSVGKRVRLKAGRVRSADRLGANSCWKTKH